MNATGWTEFTFTTAGCPLMPAGDANCLFVVPFMKNCYVSGHGVYYPAGSFGWWVAGVFTPNANEMAFRVKTVTPSVDIVDLYCLGKASSTTNISVESNMGAPLWTNEGSSTYPTSHANYQVITFDTDNTTDYPANMAKSFGGISSTTTGTQVTAAYDATHSTTISTNSVGDVAITPSSGTCVLTATLYAIKATGAQLIAEYDGSHMTSQQTDSSGNFSISATGTKISTASGNQLNVLQTADSSATNNGAFVVAGGVGIAKNLYVGGTLSVNGTIPITYTTTTGSISFLGPWASLQTVTATFMKFGTTVICYIPGVMATATNDATILSSAACIPAGYLPISSNQYCAIVATAPAHAWSLPSYAIVRTDGYIGINPGFAATFGTGGNVGFVSTTLTWSAI